MDYNSAAAELDKMWATLCGGGLGVDLMEDMLKVYEDAEDYFAIRNLEKFWGTVVEFATLNNSVN